MGAQAERSRFNSRVMGLDALQILGASEYGGIASQFRHQLFSMRFSEIPVGPST